MQMPSSLWLTALLREWVVTCGEGARQLQGGVHVLLATRGVVGMQARIRPTCLLLRHRGQGVLAAVVQFPRYSWLQLQVGQVSIRPRMLLALQLPTRVTSHFPEWW